MANCYHGEVITAGESTGLTSETVTRIRLAVLRLARRVRQESEGRITPSQVSTLATVGRHGPLTLGELAGYEKVGPPSITRMVAALEAEGLLRRKACGDDRRVAHVEVTAKGDKALQRIRNRRDSWMAGRLELLDAAELGALEAALPALERLVEGAESDEVAPR